MFRAIVSLVVLPLVLGTASVSVHADPWKDESGHGYGRKHKGGDYKEEYWDGHCKVERKWEKGGEYKEERKCKDRPAVYHQPPAVYYPPEPAIVVSPQVIIRP
ncbi:hypothetical protein [Cupriavidus sp. AcVe19-1a]|uniref:hypothetical protein n=1 Tax=Cupriavidus sp. AcVe19-1a TaxID=2821359 RepID=UPI001AE4FCE1|nr:hypothetical protein [Cupriavidus sp. AcVe19-1a]MBP0633303.1 hypothetical protein [Cupriavidus sp. AcVe19-1a]